MDAKKSIRIALMCAMVFVLGTIAIMNSSCSKDKDPDNDRELQRSTEPELNGRITWKDGKFAITADPTDGGLFFKCGSVVGIFSGNGAVLTLPAPDAEDIFDVGDLAWNPTEITDWTALPLYVEEDFPASVDDAYHTIANVKAGKGDPCRLVDLDLDKIKNTAAEELTEADIDNGKWRLPTNEDNRLFTGYSGGFGETTGYYPTAINGVNGGMFPDATDGGSDAFLPALGYRGYAVGELFDLGSYGSYWSSTPAETRRGYSLDFDENTVDPSTKNSRDNCFPVRCVPQEQE